MKDKLGEKNMKEFVKLRVKTDSDIIDDDSEDKKAKSTKMCNIKRKLKFEDYKNSLESTQFENKKTHFENNENDIDNQKKIIKNS